MYNDVFHPTPYATPRIIDSRTGKELTHFNINSIMPPATTPGDTGGEFHPILPSKVTGPRVDVPEALDGSETVQRPPLERDPRVSERVERILNQSSVDTSAPETSHGASLQDTAGFVAELASEAMDKALEEEDIKPLWKNLWYEQEVCCLFADTNLGKSIYAVEIADHISQSRPVFYFDFELTRKQFQKRYYDPETGRKHQFNHNFYRLTDNVDSLVVDPEMYEDTIISRIEAVVEGSGCNTLIIDNLTWICNGSEKGDVAGDFMRKLLALKHKHGWSVLVIAHTPKLPYGEPITANSLAGSKRLINFFDSAFAIGRSIANPGLRYIKQVKVRNGEMTHGADNVILAEISHRDDMLLCFEERGYSREDTQLTRPSANSTAKDAEVMALLEQGVSQSDIARQLGISRSTVVRAIKRSPSSGI